MNLNDAYSQAGITGSIVAAIGLGYKIYTAVNGKKIHSKCCDRDIEMGIRVEEMTPPRTHHPTISIPIERFTNPMVDASVRPKPTTQTGQVGTDEKRV